MTGESSRARFARYMAGLPEPCPECGSRGPHGLSYPWSGPPNCPGAERFLTTAPGTRMEIDTSGAATFHEPDTLIPDVPISRSGNADMTAYDAAGTLFPELPGRPARGRWGTAARHAAEVTERQWWAEWGKTHPPDLTCLVCGLRGGQVWLTIVGLGGSPRPCHRECINPAQPFR